MEAVRKIGQTATRRAGLQAYWIDLDCMTDDGMLEREVYRINDDVRGTRSLAIAVGLHAGHIMHDGSTHE